MRVWHPRAPALRTEKSPFHRRARACPSPSLALRKKRLSFSSEPKGPKTPLLTMEIAGDRPPRYGRRKVPFHRRARACPSPSLPLRKKRFSFSSGPKRPKTPLLAMEIAGETRSDARMASEGPRATVKIETGRSLLPGRHRFMKHPHSTPRKNWTYPN